MEIALEGMGPFHCRTSHGKSVEALIVRTDKDAHDKHVQVNPQYLLSKMIMHRVIMSVCNTVGEANEDEKDLGMAYKAFGYPSIAYQDGGEAHTRGTGTAALGWAVSVFL